LVFPCFFIFIRVLKGNGFFKKENLMVFSMLEIQWKQGTPDAPQGRAIIYGVGPALASLASCSSDSSDLQAYAFFHTWSLPDFLQKSTVSRAAAFAARQRYSLPSMHAQAELEGKRIFSFIPLYTAELSPCLETELPLAPSEDVLYVGQFSDLSTLARARGEAHRTYHYCTRESFAREGKLEGMVQTIAHSFLVTSILEIEPERLLFYLSNRFFKPMQEAVERHDEPCLHALQEELKLFSKDTCYASALQATVKAVTHPTCRPEHLSEYLFAHMSIIHHLAREEFEKVKVLHKQIQAMRV
jgi:hypothetical protein